MNRKEGRILAKDILKVVAVATIIPLFAWFLWQISNLAVDEAESYWKGVKERAKQK